MVVRQGQARESSVHQTQSEAAKEGREVARRERTEFYLHAQDGRVREHRDYGDEKPHMDEKGVVGTAADTAGAVIGGTTAAASHTLEAVVGSGNAPKEDQNAVASGLGSHKEKTSTDNAPAEEVGGLTNAERDDRSGTPAERHLDYEVYSEDAERLGKLDELFVDENDDPEYIGLRTDSQDARSTLIPATVVTVDEQLRRMVVSRPKSVVTSGPSLGHDEQFTAILEERVRDHYGLAGSLVAREDMGGYGTYYRGEERAATERAGTAIPDVDTPPPDAGRIANGEHGARERPEPDVLEDEEELRVRRSEEELRVGTREYEAGAVRVRKRVRTERERIRVPKKRVEVTVERVPVEGGVATSAGGETTIPEIGEDEIVVPVIEEEIVIEKRPVVREEIRIRKEVVEETEVVEEDVRREEVEIDDGTEPNDPEGSAEPAKGL